MKAQKSPMINRLRQSSKTRIEKIKSNIRRNTNSAIEFVKQNKKEMLKIATVIAIATALFGPKIAERTRFVKNVTTNTAIMISNKVDNARSWGVLASIYGLQHSNPLHAKFINQINDLAKKTNTEPEMILQTLELNSVSEQQIIKIDNRLSWLSQKYNSSKDLKEQSKIKDEIERVSAVHLIVSSIETDSVAKNIWDGIKKTPGSLNALKRMID